MNLSNRTYDVLKAFCTTYIPAAIACFITIANALQVNSEIIEAVATIVSAADTFIGICLGISGGTSWTDKTIVPKGENKPSENV